MTVPSSAPSFRTALVQLRAGLDVAQNMKTVIDFIRKAATGGAQYVQTPENTAIMDLDRARLKALAEPEDRNSSLARFSDLARDLKLHLHIGSIPIRTADDRLANRSFLFAPDGQCIARYTKIHLFDVDLANGETYRESESYEPGRSAVLAELPWGKLGLTICYDLRFPHLYRTLAQAGADFLAVPAAFTKQTGEAHWHTLLRARAIEAQCFVFAASQGGMHENGRETYGHSLIISPWGQILAEGGIDPCVIAADIDTALIAQVRSRVPSLRHDRPFRLDHS